MVKKSIDFSNEEEYIKLTNDAKLERQKVGEFILNCYRFWKENHKK
ncbi:MAG: hypothetical protein ACXAEU_19580 [Candidatus Hodarchaeales archaeon]